VAEQWFLRSGIEVHFGFLSPEGVVVARCGLRFPPAKSLFGDGPAVARKEDLEHHACAQCDGAAVVEVMTRLANPGLGPVADPAAGRHRDS
jgi:hypothetical protein